MKKLLLFLCLVFSVSLHGGLFKLPNLGSDEHVIFGASPLAEKKHLLEAVKKNQEEYLKTEKEEQEALQKRIDSLNADIAEVKKLQGKASEKDQKYLTDKASLLNEYYQTLVDMQLVRNQIGDYINKIIALLEDYIKQPTFDNERIKEHAGYQFNDLLEWNQQVVSLEEGIKQLKNEKVSAEESLNTFKKKGSDLKKEIKVKEQEQKDFMGKAQEENLDASSIHNQGILLDLQKEVLEAKQELVNQQVKETSYKIDWISSRVFIAESKLELFREDVDKISHKLLINDATLQEKENLLTKKRQDASNTQTTITKEIALLTSKRDKLKKENEELIKKENVKVDQRLLDDWSFEMPLPASNPILYKVGVRNDEILVKDREIEAEEARRELSKGMLAEAELALKVLNSWYSIMERQVRSEEFRNQEIKHYETKRAEFKREISNFQDKMAGVTSAMNTQNRVLSNIDDKLSNLKENEKEFVSRYNSDTYKKSLDALQKSKKLVNKQIDLYSKLIKSYSSLIGQFNEGIKQINLIIDRLVKIGSIWQRSSQAISFENIIKNVIPDLQEFFDVIKNIVYTINWTTLSTTASIVFHSPVILFKLFLLLALLLIAFVLARIFLPAISATLKKVPEDEDDKERGLLLRNFTAVFLDFISTHLAGLLAWVWFFVLVRMDTGIDVGFKFRILFYLISIPYFSYLSVRLVGALARFNADSNYIFISKVFQRRLHWVLIVFAISTISVFFFREAFLLALYDKHDLPIFLLRIYYIIIRVLLVCLLIKEEIISLIPTRNKTWRWIHNVVVQYYYFFLFFLLAIIILSDPHIGGYYHLVYYVLSNSLWTILLISILWYVQSLLKAYSAQAFFKHEEGEAAQERFSNATTWYGFFVVCSFIFLGIIAVFWGAKIWGHPIALDDITSWLDVKVFAVKGEDGKTIPITISSLFKVVLYIIVGIVAFNLFERIVLGRIFNLMFIDSAVQNTVSRLSFYIFILVFFLMGLSAIDISSNTITGVLFAIIVALAWSVRNAVSDLFGYFTILLERSIKIGDYIRIGDEKSEISGIVRRITPRTTILRKKNSINIILPNSKVMENPVFNWNYTRGFFAFQDLQVIVEYSADPEVVREIFLKILDEDHNILKSPHPVVRLQSFTDEGMEFMIRAFLSSINILNQWDITSDIRFKIISELRKANIQIAYPVRIIKMGSPTSDRKRTPFTPPETPDQADIDV